VISLRDDLYRGFHERNLEKVFNSVPHLFEKSLEMQSKGLARQIEAILTNSQVSGYIITQLNDVGWELEAGILDVWRNPKPAYFALKRLNQSHCLITALQTYTINPGGSTWMEVSLLNQFPLEGNEQIVVMIQNHSGALISRQLIQPVYSSGLHRLDRIKIEIGEDDGPYNIFTRLMRGQAVLVETSETIHCLRKVQWKDLEERIYAWGPLPPLFQGEDLKEFLIYTISNGRKGG